MAITKLLGAIALGAMTLLGPVDAGAQGHPSIFITKSEAAAIRVGAPRYPLLGAALADAKRTLDSAFAHPIDVPQPGEAGGYAHERHKQNYREMQLAGELFQITGDVRYARFVRDMLDKYAVLYPTLGPHPLAKDQAPGKLFHQSLNEANWLVATAIAYDCVYDWLPAERRARYEKNVFRPMADWLSVNQAEEFDRIHNHGTWATAAVGMIGYVMRDTSYVNRALYGTKRDNSGGFLRQLDLLFSPDGYYMEGAYYIRYALMPFFQFAEAIERNQPSLHIYDRRGQILRKALYSAMQVTYPNGVFVPINDASRTMNISTPEAVLALDIGYDRYGANRNLLGTAALQQQVVLNGSGLKIARDMASQRTAPAVEWPSVEFTDGPDGQDGGLGILRSGSGSAATMLLMKYGVHGQGHGHFDKLHFVFFDGGNEVVPDYGFARWINIEPKFGGRYLPENDSWAKQTIAHNTVAVDSASQSNGVYKADEAKHATRHFFDASNPKVQVMSARADGYYDGVGMQRTMFLVRDSRLPHPVVIDLYRLRSSAEHTYDLPLHFRGQLIATSVKYDAATTEQHALGSRAGYQHIWREATARSDSAVRLTWLTGDRYYSAITSAGAATEVVFGRIGAGDPNFNLVPEPMMIVRHRGSDQLFATVIEPHGYFSEPEERSVDARGSLQNVRVIATTGDASVIEVTGANGVRWTVMVNDGPASTTARHAVTAGGRTYEWTGNYMIDGLR
ncbi:MAG: alginate lyase family protein [Gemmatimonadaceae bacterium]